MSHKILIVEEESLIGWSMANALGRAGYEPEVVECGEDAIEKIRAGGIELVISDYRLPRMDGFDLAASVKKISRSLPVIMISSDEEIPSAKADAATNVDYFIDKPFNLSEIVSLVSDILEHSGPNLIKSHSPRH
jgi:DNA-binding NtrC family response regulator